MLAGDFRYTSMVVDKKLWKWIAPTLVVSGSLFFSRWFWPTLTFPDGDSFYHIKITELLAHGLVRDFPWLPFTVLSDTYIDHHFLYHVFLFPFIKLAGPFVGMKIATVLLVAAAALTFYFVLRRLQFRLPFLFTALLFTAPGFIFRLHLAKAPPFSLIFILLGVLFLVKRRTIALATLSFLYVWAYNLWPILPFIAVVWVVARSFLEAFLGDGFSDGASSRALIENSANTPKVTNISERVGVTPEWGPRLEYASRHMKDGVIRTAGPRRSRRGGALFFRLLVAPEHLRPLIGIALGSLAGLIINPYFPKNILFSWHHIVQIGVRNFQSQIGVGAEWYPTSFLQLIGHNAPLVVLFGLAVACFVLEARRRSRLAEPIAREPLLETFGLVVLAAAFFVLAVRFRRMIDIFIPFAIVAAAALTTVAWPEVRRGSQWLLNAFTKYRATIPALTATLFVVVLLPTYSTLEHRATLIKKYEPEHFAPAFVWIRDHVPSGSTIFHDAWDTFPILLVRDDRLRYVNGLDPTFFYLHDPERYEFWRRLISGEQAGEVVKSIFDEFGARYVLITGDHELFKLQLELSPYAKEVYKDKLATIFELYD